MVVPFTIHPDALKSLKPNSQEYKLWLSFLGIAHKGGILVGDSAQINDLILSAGDSSPLARNLQVLRKRKFKENEWSFANSVLNPLGVLNIEEFFAKAKGVSRFFERSLPFCCDSSASVDKVELNEKRIKEFLTPLLCLSLEVHIYDKFISSYVNDPKEDLQFYTFTVGKILEWLNECNLLVKNGKHVDLILHTGQVNYKENYDKHFVTPVNSISENVHFETREKHHKNLSNKVLDRYIYGSIHSSTGGKHSDDVLCAKISHGFNFFKVSESKKNRHDYASCYHYEDKGGRTFSERYTFPRDFYTTPDSFHGVSYDDYTKINSVFSR